MSDRELSGRTSERESSFDETNQRRVGENRSIQFFVTIADLSRNPWTVMAR